MQARLITFAASQNGISLYVTPETDDERELLKALWRFGTMKTTNGMADNSGCGFCVSWRFEGENPDVLEDLGNGGSRPQR